MLCRLWEIHGNKLCGCLNVELQGSLNEGEQAVLCDYISGSTVTAGARASSSGPLKWTAASYMSICGRAMIGASRLSKNGLPPRWPRVAGTVLLHPADHRTAICIKRGETGYYPSDWDTGDKEGNVELADELNEDLGVTPIQRQAMEIGSMAGWDVPGADPKHYEESYSGQTSCANFEQKQ